MDRECGTLAISMNLSSFKSANKYSLAGRFSAHQDAILCLAISDSGGLLASGGKQSSYGLANTQDSQVSMDCDCGTYKTRWNFASLARREMLEIPLLALCG